MSTGANLLPLLLFYHLQVFVSTIFYKKEGDVAATPHRPLSAPPTPQGALQWQPFFLIRDTFTWAYFALSHILEGSRTPYAEGAVALPLALPKYILSPLIISVNP
jgi:hypothetical protein